MRSTFGNVRGGGCPPLPSDPNVRARLTAPGGLAYELRAMRIVAGLTGVDLARITGLSSSKVSRVESGHLWPSNDDIVAWTAACGVEGHTTRLIAMLTEERASKPGWATRLQGGHLAVSKAITQYLTASTYVAWWEVDVIPGMLQTSEYALPIIHNALKRSESPTFDAVESALERANQLRVASSSVRRFDLIIGEPALTWRYADSATHSTQLGRLLMVQAMPNVHLGIVPCHRQLPDVLPNAFAMFDDVVITEDVNGEHVIVRDISAYVAAVDYLKSVAATGHVATRLIESARRRL